MPDSPRGSGPWRRGDPLPDWYFGPASDALAPSVAGVPTDVFLPIALAARALAWVAWVTLRLADRD